MGVTPSPFAAWGKGVRFYDTASGALAASNKSYKMFSGSENIDTLGNGKGVLLMLCEVFVGTSQKLKVGSDLALAPLSTGVFHSRSYTDGRVTASNPTVCAYDSIVDF